MEALTPREIEIARMVAAGRSYKGIAIDLSISARTVETHVLNAANKLDYPKVASPKMRLVLFVIDLMKNEAAQREAS